MSTSRTKHDYTLRVLGVTHLWYGPLNFQEIGDEFLIKFKHPEKSVAFVKTNKRDLLSHGIVTDRRDNYTLVFHADQKET